MYVGVERVPERGREKAIEHAPVDYRRRIRVQGADAKTPNRLMDTDAHRTIGRKQRLVTIVGWCIVLRSWDPKRSTPSRKTLSDATRHVVTQRVE